MPCSTDDNQFGKASLVVKILTQFIGSKGKQLLLSVWKIILKVVCKEVKYAYNAV